MLRELAKDAGIPVVLDGAGNRIKSHRWITDNLKGTTHRDPYDYLASIEITEAQFKLDILIPRWMKISYKLLQSRMKQKEPKSS
ncbi:hypothetical protein ACULLL_12380 [Lysinibacillus irui]|uniref:hypothetical protein n=1 Tax=Lysinibacillus irui TaxID=2998077 RepID=UPI004044F8EC